MVFVLLKAHFVFIVWGDSKIYVPYVLKDLAILLLKKVNLFLIYSHSK